MKAYTTVSKERWLIPVAGPSRSGTHDDPAKLAANAKANAMYGRALFRFAKR
ncbi:hypothetical protein [Pendulispora albinea]|uniref:Uncharacterized protein n=1 Tax=Pendulispora albinea TaxID=2741071 RepID=A0ABZ2M1Y9_9BACT